MSLSAPEAPTPVVPKLTIEMPGASTPEQHHEEAAKSIEQSLKEAGEGDHQVIPVTAETQIVVTDKEIITPKAEPAPIKLDPELTGWRKTVNRFWENLKQFKWARFRATSSADFHKAKFEAVKEKVEAASPK